VLQRDAFNVLCGHDGHVPRASPSEGSGAPIEAPTQLGRLSIQREQQQKCAGAEERRARRRRGSGGMESAGAGREAVVAWSWWWLSPQPCDGEALVRSSGAPGVEGEAWRESAVGCRLSAVGKTERAQGDARWRSARIGALVSRQSGMSCRGGDEEKRVTLSCLSRKLGNVFV
jgi:hypothetical protein